MSISTESDISRTVVWAVVAAFAVTTIVTLGIACVWLAIGVSLLETLAVAGTAFGVVGTLSVGAVIGIYTVKAAVARR
ncbi:hypothetical protein [Streptomyces toxytricini]|uniref:hypothetical protein n=1 Tax=Streptomyces toxytricini TaxID=67369 RepID=UPI00342E63DD